MSSHNRLTLKETYLENSQNAYATAFAPDSKRFAAAGGLRAVFVYRPDAPKAIGGLVDHKQSVYALLFSKSGKYFITTGRDGMIVVYDAENFDKVVTLLCPQVGQNFLATARYADGRLGKTFVADANTVKEINAEADIYAAVDYLLYELNKTPEKTAQSAQAVRRTIEQAGFKMPADATVTMGGSQLLPQYALAMSPDESKLYVGASHGVLKVYNTADWSLERVLPLHSGNIRTVAVSPDGQLLATGSSDRYVKILDAQTFETLHTIEGHGDSVFAVAFSADGAQFATGGKDARLRIWNVAGKSIKPKVKILAHTFSIKAMSFIGGSKEILTVSQDKTIKIWDIEKVSCVETIDRLYGGHTFTINTVSVSPDERYAVTGSDDKTVKLWELGAK
jgi:WD40 repeat protein